MAGLPHHDTMAPPKGLQLVGLYAFPHHAMGVLVGGAHALHIPVSSSPL